MVNGVIWILLCETWLQKKEIILLSVMNRIYDISLELDILCPEPDSRKLVLVVSLKNLSN